MKQIKSITTLNKVLQDKKEHEFRVVLKGGLYSRKTIKSVYKPDLINYFRVTNHIDNSKQLLNSQTIMDPEWTNIGEAMKKGAFILVE